MSQTSIEPTTGLERERQRKLLQQMLLIRRFEEKCAELYSAGKIRGFVHLYVGEEAVAVGVMDAITSSDNIVATYREHGHALARGISMDSLMAEMYGKQEGSSHGRGGSMHIFDVATRFFGGNAIVGGGLPIAVGLGLADRMRGDNRLTACFFGDGAVAEGVFHESMNLAALWHLPVLFCCENNLYAMGTAVERAQSETNLAAKACSYKMPAQRVDGMDVLAVAEVAHVAAAAIREGSGPQFLELLTYRFRAHSMYDPDRYRDKGEIERWKQRDPITSFAARLESSGIVPKERFARMEREVEREIDHAVEFAEAGAFEPVEDLTRFVYSEAPR
ncbi:MAG: pyruvate dehydrogenase (acetyl-transferring) E1 component subunit alpha [Hyphomicrobiales bacterium]